GVGDERDRRAVHQLAHELRALPALVVLVIAGGRSPDLVTGQQNPGVASVLAGDQIDLAQHAERAQRHVLEVADRRGDDEEGTGRRRQTTPTAMSADATGAAITGGAGVVGELEPHLFEVEVLLVLLDDRVLRLLEDAHQGLLVEVVERRDHGEPAHELGDEAVLEQVLRLDHGQQVADPPVLPALDLGPEAHAGPTDPALDDLVEADEPLFTVRNVCWPSLAPTSPPNGPRLR